MSEPKELQNAIVRLGATLADFRTRPFANNVWEKAKACLLDALGLSLIAREEATTRAICSLSEASAPREGGVLIWPCGRKGSLSEAVTANAVSVHAHFHDDSDPHSWCHPGSLISPVAVGAAESMRGSIELALRGLVAGYSILNWMGDHECVAHALIKRGVRTSPTLGTIGAAAAASVTLGLDETQATNALAIAASITGGTLAPLRCGSDEWRVQNAHAARGGLLAAQLAKSGVNGAQTALDGAKGLLQTYAGLEEIPSGWNKSLQEDAILRIYAKPWATLGDNMAPVRAAKLLHDDGLDIEQIERIELTLWRAYAEYPGTQYKGPFDLPVQALASTSFAVAAMLTLGDLEYDVSLERRNDPRLLKLVNKITIIPSDEGTKLDSTVTVHLRNGTRRVRRADEAPKNWLYHDAQTAIDIFEKRLSRIGRPPGTGRLIGTSLFDASGCRRPLTSLLEQVCHT